MSKCEKIAQAIDYIVNEFPEWEGQAVHGGDLGSYLTEDPNANGIYEDDSWGFIKEHLEDAADEFNYERSEFGEAANPFDDPEGFVVRMLVNTVDAILARVPLVNERWNRRVDWTAEDIKSVIRWLTEDDEVAKARRRFERLGDIADFVPGGGLL